MSRSNLEVWLVKVAAHAPCDGWHLCLRVSLFTALLIETRYDFVEARQHHRELLVGLVFVVRGRFVCHPVLHDGVHLTYGEEDAPRELVLIIDHQPAVKRFAHIWLQDLCNWQLVKLLFFKDVVISGGLGPVAKLLRILGRRLLLAHDLAGMVGVHDLHIDVRGGRQRCIKGLVIASLEAFHSFKVNHALDHIQALNWMTNKAQN